MWLLRVPSKEEALHYFEQSPDIVMRPRDMGADDVAKVRDSVGLPETSGS